MNPIAPVSMLAGSGSGKAVLVISLLVGLALYARSQQSSTPPKQ